MNYFEGTEYQPCKEWVAENINEKYSWGEIENLCVENDQIEEKLAILVDDFMWPEEINIDRWREFIKYYRDKLIPVSFVDDKPVIAIDNGTLSNRYSVPNGVASAWEQYKEYLRANMSDNSIGEIQKSCVWVLNHLMADTRSYGAVKGLITGSVQSGKTANMEGLVCMAADYDWNFFIILSGTIDNLRKQTRDRFMKDLQNSEGIYWKVLDFNGEDRCFDAEELKLNPLSGSKNYGFRYVTVCLKNKKRLETLIDWLYDDDARASKLRITVIDDEADQASINTADITPDEEQERCAINQLIVNLINGKKSDGSNPKVKFQAMNYISYTATPYANVLNESSEESLYPKDFICTLPEAHEYFGAKVIFGNDEADCPGFNIIREITSNDEKELKKIHKQKQFTLTDGLKASISWFLCTSAILRTRNHKKSVSMLIHTSCIQREHFVMYRLIDLWLNHRDNVLMYCESVYNKEFQAVRKSDLLEANPNYGLMTSVIEDKFSFEEIRPEIEELLDEITNISLADDKSISYKNGVHICVDNCQANKEADDGMHLRIVYPNDQQLEIMKKAPVFIIIGGNTLSRGLTIDGLVCTYFARNTSQADTLMQMARWFGYRKGYELLQRIWMTESVQKKFIALAKIDMDLKKEVERFMERGISPAQFGPRIRNTPEIAKFRITAKKKSQQAEYDDFDFCGDSYENTDFDNDESLEQNILTTDEFLKKMKTNFHHRKSTAAKAIVWDKVDYSIIRDNFLNRYIISEHSSLSVNLPIFAYWMTVMNEEGKFLRWNVAVVDGDNMEAPWVISDIQKIGCIERTRKSSKQYIDIGSLRSGRDAICDVDESSFTTEQIENFKATRKNGKNIISKRCDFNLEDMPLLLIYRIKKDGGTPNPSGSREKMNTLCDIIGISIIVSGDSIGESHAKSLRINGLRL